MVEEALVVEAGGKPGIVHDAAGCSPALSKLSYSEPSGLQGGDGTGPVDGLPPSVLPLATTTTTTTSAQQAAVEEQARGGSPSPSPSGSQPPMQQGGAQEPRKRRREDSDCGEGGGQGEDVVEPAAWPLPGAGVSTAAAAPPAAVKEEEREPDGADEQDRGGSGGAGGAPEDVDDGDYSDGLQDGLLAPTAAAPAPVPAPRVRLKATPARGGGFLYVEVDDSLPPFSEDPADVAAWRPPPRRGEVHGERPPQWGRTPLPAAVALATGVVDERLEPRQADVLRWLLGPQAASDFVV